LPKPKEATRETVPQPTKRGSVDRAPGEEREGDPYLNRLWTLIEQHRTYPAGAVGSLGLNLEGTVVYVIALSPAGAIQGMRLERSSGAPVLDETARRMIEQAAPFPPLPNYFPRNGVTLSVTIHLFPTAS
jgi:TonB family protein